MSTGQALALLVFYLWLLQAWRDRGHLQAWVVCVLIGVVSSLSILHFSKGVT